jgi:hypothetical protein
MKNIMEKYCIRWYGMEFSTKKGEKWYLPRYVSNKNATDGKKINI